MAINIIHKTSTNNTTYRANRSLQYIVLHYTAGTTSQTGSARNCAYFFANAAVQASADFIVDDTEIVQYNPDLKNRYCWHCGDGSGGAYGGYCYNSNSIGIEMCSWNTTGKITAACDSYFYLTDETVATAKKLVQYLMSTYNIPASRVIRHYDVSTKWCPGVRGWIPVSGSDESKWKAFKASLTGSVSSATQQTTKAETVDHSPCVASGMQTFKNSTGDDLPVYSSSIMDNKIGSLNPNETCYCFGKIWSNTANRWMWLVAYGLDAYPGDYKAGYVDDGGNTNFK